MRSGGMRPGAGAGAGAVGTLNWRAYREVRCRNFYATAGRLAGENAGPRKPWLSLAESMTELFQTKELRHRVTAAGRPSARARETFHPRPGGPSAVNRDWASAVPCTNQRYC